MRLKRRAIKLFKKIQKLPKELTISVGVLVVVAIGYTLVFGIEKPVTFSYTGVTCVKQLTVLPTLHRNDPRSLYTAQSNQELRIGRVPLIGLSMCFFPKEAPQAGVTKISTSPFGGWIARKTFRLQIDSPPKANIANLTKPIPVSKPLEIPLSNIDKVFSYSLRLDDKQVHCTAKNSKLLCNIQALHLGQGKVYRAELARYFRGEKVGLVASKTIQTLSATSITNSSIESGGIVYTKPKTIEITLDKEVTHAQAVLYQVEGNKRTEVETTSNLHQKTLQVSFKTELPRSADYELTIDKVTAIDGSTLEAPYLLDFKTSGGPKVTGISIGRTGIPLGSTAVISFDQPLSEKQDIGALVSLTGGAALIGRAGNQILVSLKSVPKCGDFSIKLTNDLQSNYDIAGNSTWSFAGRVICYTVETIGYSSKGRPINAYFFGNGNRTVLFTGAIHGNEIGTKGLMNAWIQELEANARNIPADKQVVVIPQINPDGVVAGNRLNGRGIDLNRNFATSDWRTDITDVNNNPFPGGGGPSPMSEPETVALASFAGRLRPILILSYHSIGGVLAANQAGDSTSLASTYSQLSGYANMTGQTSTTFEYEVSGTADDWYAEHLGAASILVELSSHTASQFDRNQRAMWAMVNQP